MAYVTFQSTINFSGYWCCSTRMVFLHSPVNARCILIKILDHTVALQPSDPSSGSTKANKNT